jgi:hypothetical protein
VAVIFVSVHERYTPSPTIARRVAQWWVMAAIVVACNAAPLTRSGTVAVSFSGVYPAPEATDRQEAIEILMMPSTSSERQVTDGADER